jgi:hypothetical protein
VLFVVHKVISPVVVIVVDIVYIDVVAVVFEGVVDILLID